MNNERLIDGTESISIWHFREFIHEVKTHDVNAKISLILLDADEVVNFKLVDFANVLSQEHVIQTLHVNAKHTFVFSHPNVKLVITGENIIKSTNTRTRMQRIIDAIGVIEHGPLEEVEIEGTVEEPKTVAVEQYTVGAAILTYGELSNIERFVGTKEGVLKFINKKLEDFMRYIESEVVFNFNYITDSTEMTGDWHTIDELIERGIVKV